MEASVSGAKASLFFVVFFVILCRTTRAHMAETTGLTEAEAEVYDRQLRVWGVAAQQRCVCVCVACGGGPRAPLPPVFSLAV